MKIKAEDILHAIDSRGGLTTVLLLLIVSALYGLKHGLLPTVAGRSQGVLCEISEVPMFSPSMSMWLNIALMFMVIVIMIYINKAYTIPRNITLLYAIFFTVLQTATPVVSSTLCPGTIMLVLIVALMTVMFGLFGRAQGQSAVFMVFFMLSATLAFQYAYAFYIPVFVIACAQMRIMSLRTVLAIVFGLIAPWWIMFGFGIVNPESLRLPSLSLDDFVWDKSAFISVLCAAVTIIIALSSYGLSLLKLMSYNARTRSCNGLLTLIMFATILAMAVDFTNYLTYLPLLNFCTAFFLSHFLVIRNPSRSWIVIVSIIAIYYAFYLWRIFV